MKKLLLVILLFSASCVCSQNVKRDMELHFDVDTFDMYKSLSLTILSPENKQVWYREIAGTTSEDEEIKAINWYSVPGKYKINVDLKCKDTLRRVKDSLEFNISGEENKIFCSVDIGYLEDNKTIHLSCKYMEKYFAASDSILLEEKWIPKKDGIPNYKIHNNSSRIIYGLLGMQFEGSIEKFYDGLWRLYYRGYIDGTNAGHNVLNPGKSRASVEGSFVSKPEPFTKGRYRYIVYFTYDHYSLGVTTQSNVIFYKEVRDLYILEKEFEIKEE